MTDTITKLIHQELLTPSWEMTKQLLTCMEVELADEQPKIEGIVIRQDIGRATGYVAVKDEPFYIGVSFDIEGSIELNGVDAEPRIHLYYLATLEEQNSEFLLGLTQLTPSEIIRKGDLFTNKAGEYTYSGLSFESADTPGTFEEKLDEFLTYLEQDIPGISALAEHTGDNDIFITLRYHISTGIFTQLYLAKSHIVRLARLGLSVTFDQYVHGKPLRG
ncbi:DUF4279 domain-containing protein [Hymenobacter cellulosivorans]|uniref:DUF4279 domain-containing protein n=1 Tax=Hymenobacter cellulosivorans TaxID=2932249 RepID=A0ABY4F752_9BACT|nr:DUF4279 domain-containing protein [Hymenobacter cellulosivorans]UOQ52495.1 DUF4279 domain-containing protein [Hymenobacter cellulosivorans]